MKNTIISAAAFAATAYANAVIYTECEGNCGSANVISHCDSDIHFLNQPSQGEAVGAQVLTAGSSYSQVFTAMPNLSGWSMKFSPDSSFPSDNTQQYEYTWQGGDQPVWYDMSYVNGQPYTSWNFTSSDDSVCDPTGQAYRYSTDDQYGMQASCPMHVTLTLHLCPENAGSSSSSGSSGSGESAAPAPSSTEATSAYVAPTTSAYVAPTTAAPQTTLATQASASASASASQGYGNKVQIGAAGSIAYEAGSDASTTAIAVSSTVVAADGAVVTETQVEVVTAVQTFYVSARDAAPTAHAHRRRHEHRHPHNGRA